MLFSPCVSYRRIRSATPSHVLPRLARPPPPGNPPPAAVEDHGFDPGLLGALRQEPADGLGRAGLALAAALQLAIRGRRDGPRGVVVYQLRVDMAVGPVHGQPRPLSRADHLATDPGVTAHARLALGLRVHQAAPFAALPAFLRTYSFS